MERKADRIPALFRKSTNYAWLTLAVVFSCMTLGLVVLAVLDITGHFNAKAPLFFVAAGFYGAAVLLLSAVFLVKEWKEFSLSAAIRERLTGSELSPVFLKVSTAVEAIVCAGIATGLLTHALSG